MSLRRMETTIEVPQLVSGFGGFPQLPEKRRRWYACNIGYIGRTCYEIPTKLEEPAFCPQCKSVNVPAYLPKFLDKYVIQHKFNDSMPVRISEQTMSPGTYCLGRLTPPEQPLGSPSAHQVPSVNYTGAHKQPKNPFQ